MNIIIIESLHYFYIKKNDHKINNKLCLSFLQCRWRKEDWIEDFWLGYDKALAVRNMVNAGEKKSKNFEKYLNEIVSKRH